ncbi:MAG: preprotein translocase subunit SecE [Candidatus Acidiferrales bacterium]|jgi:preprotein translocase subunit SecE
MNTQAVKAKDNEERGGGIPGSGALEKVGETVRDSKEFLHDVRVELKQVTWPTRNDVISTTWVVLVTVAFFGVFLWVVDMGVQRAVTYIMKLFGAGS